MVNESLRDELIKMRAYDQLVRAELAADGSLFDGYHPRMEAVHRAHATRLRGIIEALGWPGEAVVGSDGAEAAWMIAQHAIGEPQFMRECRDLLETASARGEVPRWQFAFIDDRIRVFEDRPQKYGTQLRGSSNGLEPCSLENPTAVEQSRRELGLPALADILARARENPPPRRRAQAAADAQELAWRRKVGWIA